MKTYSISDVRTFNLKEPVNAPLAEGESLRVHVWHFEAGQSITPPATEAAYHVLEGELRFTKGKDATRLSKGSVLVGAPQSIDNPSGGLAVVVVTSAR